jgi:putative ABC transport system permease protein
VGLFGLSAYTASLRTKEIGVRKVLGASVAGVTVLLSKDFTKLVLIAFVIATPVSWWLMNNWLQSFAYRITPGAGSFLLAGVAALTIAWLTVSYQSIKAAMVNPVKSLRSE